MIKLAVLALNKAEHRILADVWKFFPYGNDVQYFYAYFGTKRSPEPAGHKKLHAKRFAGKPINSIGDVGAFLDEYGVKQLCFASLASFSVWQDASGLEVITLFSSRDLCLADISSSGASSSSELEDFARRAGKPLAALQSEKTNIALPPDAIVYKDFQAFQRSAGDEILITRNKDLLSALRGSRDFVINHFHANSKFSNLGLEDGQSDFTAVLNKILQATQTARDCQAKSASGRFVPNDLQPPFQPVYSLFAKYYDNYMSHVNYEDWVQVMLSWRKRFSKEPLKKVLEIACGTANAAEIMVYQGLEVDACDNSPYMLHVADQKIFKPDLFLCSLTDPLPQKDYDFIFCLFDSVNYLTRKSDIKTLLNNVSAALRPGGIFIFDISTLLNSLENFNDRYSITRVKDGYLIQISTFEILSYRQITQFIFFRQNPLGYEKSEERHVQRVYRSSELLEIIYASDLKPKAIFTPQMRTNLLNKQGGEIDNRHFRLFFLVQKN